MNDAGEGLIVSGPGGVADLGGAGEGVLGHEGQVVQRPLALGRGAGIIPVLKAHARAGVLRGMVQIVEDALVGGGHGQVGDVGQLLISFLPAGILKLSEQLAELIGRAGRSGGRNETHGILGDRNCTGGHIGALTGADGGGARTAGGENGALAALRIHRYNGRVAGGPIHRVVAGIGGAPGPGLHGLPPVRHQGEGGDGVLAVVDDGDAGNNDGDLRRVHGLPVLFGGVHGNGGDGGPARTRRRNHRFGAGGVGHGNDGGVFADPVDGVGGAVGSGGAENGGDGDVVVAGAFEGIGILVAPDGSVCVIAEIEADHIGDLSDGDDADGLRTAEGGGGDDGGLARAYGGDGAGLFIYFNDVLVAAAPGYRFNRSVGRRDGPYGQSKVPVRRHRVGAFAQRHRGNGGGLIVQDGDDTGGVLRRCGLAVGVLKGNCRRDGGAAGL